jgi:RNA polymerase sigma factor (sigma-70 family)
MLESCDPVVTLDDGELLACWRAGDREAGSELFERHFTSVFTFFRSKVEGAADDLTQQTFLRCVQARDELPADKVRAYLFAIARNLLVDHLRRSARRPEPVDLEVTALADVAPSPSSAIAAREQHQLLLLALRRLPLGLQIILELAYVQRMRGQELAIALDIPLGTVRSRLRRAIEQLGALQSELATSPRALGGRRSRGEHRCLTPSSLRRRTLGPRPCPCKLPRSRRCRW